MATARPLQPHWALMQKFDANMYEKCTQWRDAITYNKFIPLKEQELIMVAMCCLIRFQEGLRVHVKYALKEGAAKEELFAAAAASMLLGGVPAYRDGIFVIEEVLRGEGITL
jgi:alkylhydroperoxidase/carboxymuconolactone decarboxylase family protein YurZ